MIDFLLFDHPTILWNYSIGFFSALVMPNYRSLGIYMLVICVLAVLTVYAIILVIFIWIGAAVGAVFNAVGLGIIDRRRDPMLFVLYALITFALPPMVLAGPERSFAWLNRPSVAECRATEFPIQMGSLKLSFTGEPAFYVQDFRRPLNGDGHSIAFNDYGDSTDFLYFCSEAKATNAPFKNIALEIRNDWISPNWVQNNCEQPDSDLKKQLCLIKKMQQNSGAGGVLEEPNEEVSGILIYPKELSDKYLGFRYSNENDLSYGKEVSFSCTPYERFRGPKKHACSAAGIATDGVYYRINYSTASSDLQAVSLRHKNTVFALIASMQKPKSD